MMKAVKREYVIAMAGLMLAGAVNADVTLPPLFASDMVIQRDADAPVWGWADAGEALTVMASWGESATAIANDSGRWQVKLATRFRSRGFSLLFCAISQPEPVGSQQS